VNGTILVYGNDEMLVTTRQLILGKAGYEVFSATNFASALTVLVNEAVNVLLLCQSLTEEERRGILETGRAIQPEIKCLTFGYDGLEIVFENGESAVKSLNGPASLVQTIARLLHSGSPSSNMMTAP
jgi:DNA-binding NtrC family response regulator